ncbi:MAG TPA: hypothetical protein VMZ53_07055 [Kofleriaceae bacterium]|nr:hypothetical protein [Kofleriaceae bacterium]
MKGLLLCAALVGCAPNATYGYQYQLTQQFTGGEEPEAPGVEARQLLAGAKTVAFYPPDTCLNAETVVANRKLQEVRANCGVLMSTLERAAQRAGYEVLSWQNLRGGRAIDFAREGKVDVLFEINEFEITPLDDNAVERSMRFFEVHEDGNETALPVTQATGAQCANYAKAHDKTRTVAVTGSIDIKTVNVSDGRDRWHYRKTREKQFQAEYPRSTFTGKGKTHPLERGLRGVFVGALILAVDLIILDELLNDDPTTMDLDENFDPSPWQWVSAGVAGASLGGMIAVHYKLPVKPEASKVLCNVTTADAAKTVVQVGTLSAQHTFTEVQTGDITKRDYEQVRDEMIGDFIKILSEAHPH